MSLFSKASFNVGGGVGGVVSLRWPFCVEICPHMQKQTLIHVYSVSVLLSHSVLTLHKEGPQHCVLSSFTSILFFHYLHFCSSGKIIHQTAPCILFLSSASLTLLTVDSSGHGGLLSVYVWGWTQIGILVSEHKRLQWPDQQKPLEKYYKGQLCFCDAALWPWGS